MRTVIAAPAPGDDGRDDKNIAPNERPETASQLAPPDPDFKLCQLTERPEPHPDLRALLGYPASTRHLSDAAKGAVLRDTRHLLHEIALSAGPAQQSVRALIDLYDVETQRPWAKGIQTAFNALPPAEQAQPLSLFIETPKPNRAPAPHFPSAAADGWPPIQYWPSDRWPSPLWPTRPEMNSQDSNASSGSKESNSPGTSGRQREHYVRTDEGSEWVSALVTWVLPVAANLQTIGRRHESVTSRRDSFACATDAAEGKPRPLVHEALSTLESQLEGLKEWLAKADGKRPGPLLQAVKRPLGALTDPSDVEPWQRPIAEMEYEMDRYRSLVYLGAQAVDWLGRESSGSLTFDEKEGYVRHPLERMAEVARTRSPFQLCSDNSMTAWRVYCKAGQSTQSDESDSSETDSESVDTRIEPIENLSEEQYTALVKYVLSQSFIFQTESNKNHLISPAALSMADELEKPLTFKPDYMTIFRTFWEGKGLEKMLGRALMDSGDTTSPSWEQPLTNPEDALRKRVTMWIDAIENLWVVRAFRIDRSAFAEARRAEFGQAGTETEEIEAWVSDLKMLRDTANRGVPIWEIAQAQRRTEESKQAAINVLVTKPQAIFNILDALGNEAKPR